MYFAATQPTFRDENHDDDDEVNCVGFRLIYVINSVSNYANWFRFLSSLFHFLSHISNNNVFILTISHFWENNWQSICFAEICKIGC